MCSGVVLVKSQSQDREITKHQAWNESAYNQVLISYPNTCVITGFLWSFLLSQITCQPFPRFQVQLSSNDLLSNMISCFAYVCGLNTAAKKFLKYVCIKSTKMHNTAKRNICYIKKLGLWNYFYVPTLHFLFYLCNEISHVTTTTLGLIQRKKSTALGLGTLYSLSFSKLRPLQVILWLLAMNKPSWGQSQKWSVRRKRKVQKVLW